MLGSTLLSFVAGLVTILNPCVLPLIPILIGSALSKSKMGPVALAAGLVTSFTIFGFGVIAFGYSIGINEQAVRIGAGLLLAVAGFVLLVPRAQAALSGATAPIANFGNQQLGRVTGDGAGGQFAIGLLLGLVWAPCVGPTLGVAIAAASSGQDLLSSFFIFLVFGLGVATSILAFAYGSRRALKDKRDTMVTLAKYGKPLFGAALLVVGLMVVTGFDKVIEAALLGVLPQSVIEFTTQF
ncbi:cytochrome c biogenesis CcdA family protein [Parerythrobacter jejuensis]|uniref:Cytochrome c biogenesis protein CcdA n=1 Tax=Parerythrobacter jejuensis TaxID=795812 RepID=A0A845AV14_9SPHN|nr:cytochrome c biogenesis CcdA family protein [Parerythrobacter jejuensis]MXP32925.1 cytochrome c biogenesis protein CcdA [Parerythrobacter jejuensis]